MTIHLKWPPSIQHTREEEDLLRDLYDRKTVCPVNPNMSCPLHLGADFGEQPIKQVIVEREMRPGFSGARLLVVTPVEDDGTLQTRRVVKLGPRVMLEPEIRNYYKFVQEHLVTAVAAQKNFVIHGTMAAVEYIFIGGGMLDPVCDLATYCEEHSADEIVEILESLLSEHLGQYWYSQKKLAIEFVYDEYGYHMPEQIKLDLHSFFESDSPSSPVRRRGLERVLQKFAKTLKPDYRPLELEVLLHDQKPAAPGELVQIRDMKVVRIKPWATTFVHKENRTVQVRVDYDKESGLAERLSIGQHVTIQGRVTATRHGLLETVVQAAFEDCGEVDVSPDSDQILADLGCGFYTNPLKLYSRWLNEPIEVYHSIIHGDLHTRNVMIDGEDQPWLIDFGQVRKGQTLFDFVRLETYLRRDVLSEALDLTLAEYIRFEEALASATYSDAPIADAPTNADLQKAFYVIQAIRRSASLFHTHRNKRENLTVYFACLLVHSLGLLKYVHKAAVGKGIEEKERDHLFKIARLCFITASVQGRWLDRFRLHEL